MFGYVPFSKLSSLGSTYMHCAQTVLFFWKKESTSQLQIQESPWLTSDVFSEVCLILFEAQNQQKALLAYVVMDGIKMLIPFLDFM